jgi:hypothetical protein
LEQHSLSNDPDTSSIISSQRGILGDEPVLARSEKYGFWQIRTEGGSPPSWRIGWPKLFEMAEIPFEKKHIDNFKHAGLTCKTSTHLTF